MLGFIFVFPTMVISKHFLKQSHFLKWYKYICLFNYFDPKLSRPHTHQIKKQFPCAQNVKFLGRGMLS